MSAPLFRQPLEVLLGRFASRCDAISAHVIGSEGGSPATWATLRRDGTEPEAEAPWKAVAAQVLEDGRVRLGTGMPGLPDMVVAVPVEPPGGPPAALCCSLEVEALNQAPTILWTARSFAQTMALCLDDPAGFGRMIGAAVIDPLTQCHNAMAMWDSLDREINRALRQRTPLACTFVDLDNFSDVNEEGGHLKGDVVLGAVGAVLAGCVRGYDTVARFGGDEFVVIMPNATEKQARALVARMARDIAGATASLTSSPITASFGTVQLRFDESAASLLERADQRMLEAKRARRSQAPVPQ